jgi:ABC-type sugar transport system permease subunit
VGERTTVGAIEGGQASSIARAHSRRRQRVAYLYVAPAVIVFAAFLAFPVGFAAWLSFHDWNGLTPISQTASVGVANFQELRGDAVFRAALRHTVFFAIVSTLVQMAIAFLLAFTLWFYRPRFASFLRAFFFFPTVISMVFVGLVWQQMLTQGGPVDSLLAAFGVGHVDWLSNSGLVMWVVVWVSTWQWSGWTMVLYLAGMTGLPRDLIEAARIDGAGGLAIAGRVVLPNLRYVTGLVILLNVIGGFQVFDTIYVLTGGGPNHASEVLGTYSYWLAFSGFGPGEIGYASALAIVMIAVLFVFAYVRIRMTRLV